MNVRDARQSDLESIAELLLLVHRMHVQAQPATYRDIGLDAAREHLATRLADPQSCVRVAELDSAGTGAKAAGSAVAGYYSAVVQESASALLLQPGASLYLNEIVVRPGSRRSGVGRALVADLKQFALQRGVAQIKLDVGSFNAAARAFFESQGFDVVGERMRAGVGD